MLITLKELPVTIMSAGDMSQSSLVSATLAIPAAKNMSVQLTWTSNAVGSYAVQVSNDQVNWANLDTTGAPAIAGTPGSVMLDLITSAPYLQVIYSRTSGAGALTVSVSSKGGVQ
jgi:hypothetical protein